MNCVTCNIETKNPKFCGKSCSAKYNNKLIPKRRFEGSCCNCSKAITRRGKYCRECFADKTNSLRKKLESQTIGSIRDKLKAKNYHPSWIHSQIRALNRSWNKSLLALGCRNCSYNKHVELAHVIPISSFTDDVLVGHVNAKNNVIPLCPNCHWEFDNKLLKMETLGIEPRLQS